MTTKTKQKKPARVLSIRVSRDADGRRVPVSTRALIQRINRKLRADEQTVKQTRDGTRARLDLGEFYIYGWNPTNIVAFNVDLQSLGREVGALQPYEAWDTGDE